MIGDASNITPVSKESRLNAGDGEQRKNPPQCKIILTIVIRLTKYMPRYRLLVLYIAKLIEFNTSIVNIIKTLSDKFHQTTIHYCRSGLARVGRRDRAMRIKWIKNNGTFKWFMNTRKETNVILRRHAALDVRLSISLSMLVTYPATIDVTAKLGKRLCYVASSS